LAKPHNAQTWHQAWPFAILCLLASTVWLLVNRYPQITFTPSSDALGCTIAAIVALAATLRTARPSLPETLRCGFAGALVLAGSSAGIFLHAPSIDGGSLAIALSLTPVVIVVTKSALGTEEFSSNHLWPGLAAAVALLLVLPAPSVSDLRNNAALVIAPILTGVGCVLFRRSTVTAAWKAVSGFAGAALIFGLGALVEGLPQRTLPPVSPAALAIDTLLFALAILSLNRLTASQYAARYAVVPLIILLQGPLLLHLMVTWRNIACAALLLAAAITLLRSGPSEKVSTEVLEDHKLRG
jgi:hypothetical protein